jgi:RimJ/RimL family protein N-acetyltransferase
VLLREQRESDAARILEARGDQRSSYWLGDSRKPEDLDDAIAYVRTRQPWMAEGTALYWVVADPADDDLLGSVALRELDGPTGAEIGYWTHPRARGRGVMTEAVRLAVRHAFIDVEDGGLGLDKLRLVTAVENLASRRVAEANGFREAGVERLGTLCSDGRHDAAIYDLLPADLR